MNRPLLGSALVLVALGCGASPSPVAEPPAATATSRPEAGPVELRLATFNIQVLGPAKSARPEVMSILAQIIRRYDVVAVQEIRDSSGRAALRLLAAINAGTGPRDALALSERTGRQPRSGARSDASSSRPRAASRPRSSRSCAASAPA